MASSKSEEDATSWAPVEYRLQTTALRGKESPTRGTRAASEQVVRRTRQNIHGTSYDGRGSYRGRASRSSGGFAGAATSHGQQHRIESNRPHGKFQPMPPHENWAHVLPMNEPHSLKAEEHRVTTSLTKTELSELRKTPDTSLIKAAGFYLLPKGNGLIHELKEDEPEVDQVRNEFKCCIVTDKVAKCLRVFSTDEEQGRQNIADTIQRLQIVMKDLATRANKCLRFILAEAPAGVCAPLVEMLPADAPYLATTNAPQLPKPIGHQRVAVVKPGTISVDKNIWKRESFLIKAKNVKCLEWAIDKSLSRLSADTGRVEIRALFGAFVFTRYTIAEQGSSDAGDVRTSKDFWTMIKHEMTRGELLRLGTEAQLYERVTLIDEVLEGYCKGTRCHLNEVKPTYAGIFTFDPSSGHSKKKVKYQLSVEAGDYEDKNGNLTVDKREWSGMFDDPESRCLEAFFLSLNGGICWKLDIAYHPHRKEVPMAYRRFSQQISVGRPRLCDAAGSTGLMFEFKPPQGLQDFRQRTTWKFYLKDSMHLIFELSRIDKFGPNLTKHPQLGAETENAPKIKLGMQPTSTQWEASVYDERWEQKCGTTGVLGRKQREDREALQELFPSDKIIQDPAKFSGVEEFVESVQKLSHAVSAVLPWSGHQ